MMTELGPDRNLQPEKFLVSGEIALGDLEEGERQAIFKFWSARDKILEELQGPLSEEIEKQIKIEALNSVPGAKYALKKWARHTSNYYLAGRDI